MGIETLMMVGIDKRAPVEVREKSAFGRREAEALKKLKNAGGISEAVVLSTCHRSEIYFVSVLSDDSAAKSFFCDFSGLSPEDLAPHVCTLRGAGVVRHLFRVACGLESMVLGEDQILGQVRDAWDLAREEKGAGKILNRLFKEAVTLGKRARAETGITEYPISISYIAVKFIQKVMGDLRDREAFVIGAGEMGQLAIKYLLQAGIKDVYISNRTMEKAEELKRLMPELSVIPYEQKYNRIAQSDIVISATNAPHYTVDFEKFRKNCTGKSICMIDIAVPRDINPAIGSIEGVKLYTLDDLQEVAEENRKKRQSFIDVIEKMVDESVREFLAWINSLSIIPVIKHLNDFAEKVCLSEYERLINKLDGITEDEKSKVRIALERVGAKIVNRYLMGLKTLAEEGRLDRAVYEVFQKN
ncbi:MAG: glutamyl-tRNA reductase [Tepidanaerobacteraceae bacterium]|jgi:glutamyl-tRNA reductase|nr:glutamyl-tRNA reductase [Tepidanaerobacteraceae bacterium]